jgi:hypothetical protein
LKPEIIFSTTGYGATDVSMNQDNSQAGKDVERRRIEQALARLEEAVSRCREEDVRDGTGVLAALEFLALRADEQWPFEQFRGALANAGMDTTKPEARWQVLNASLNGIKRVIRR